MAAFFAAASGGCAGRHEAGDATAPNSTAPTTLTIHNYNWLDAVIYVYHDGELTRVGSVTAASSANFMLAPWVLGPTRNIRLAVPVDRVATGERPGALLIRRLLTPSGPAAAPATLPYSATAGSRYAF